jgi:hypothetical protein
MTADDSLLNVDPAHNWKPGQRMRVRKSAAHTIDGAMSMLRSAVRRDDFDLAELEQIVQLGLPAELLAGGVATCRERGYSWAEIGRAVGTSREAAFQRWRNAR